MDLTRGIVIWGLVAIASAALGGVLAGVKNRDHSFWIAWCFVFPPMLIFILLLPKHEGVRPRKPTSPVRMPSPCRWPYTHTSAPLSSIKSVKPLGSCRSFTGG